jgi:hypothetical protein
MAGNLEHHDRQFLSIIVTFYAFKHRNHTIYVYLSWVEIGTFKKIHSPFKLQCELHKCGENMVIVMVMAMVEMQFVMMFMIMIMVYNGVTNSEDDL